VGDQIPTIEDLAAETGVAEGLLARFREKRPLCLSAEVTGFGVPSKPNGKIF
jgi:hypothetical protein